MQRKEWLHKSHFWRRRICYNICICVFLYLYLCICVCVYLYLRKRMSPWRRRSCYNRNRAEGFMFNMCSIFTIIHKHIFTNIHKYTNIYTNVHKYTQIYTEASKEMARKVAACSIWAFSPKHCQFSLYWLHFCFYPPQI